MPQETFNQEFINQFNAMRANPASFIPDVKAYQRQVQSFTRDKKALKNAVAEITSILTKLKPLPILRVDSALTHAAKDHMLDGAKTGIVGHIGSDSSNPHQRVARYGTFSQLSESITYGNLSTSLMLAAFLVDEGTPSRGHRTALLGRAYTLIGVAFGPHPEYSSHIVVLLADSAASNH